MPLTVPPFSQFQGNLFPLRGLWNKRPPEGDYFVNAEIDWGSANTSAIQFALSGNSPVAMSQIVALYVDNRRCGVDCDFLFPDSGFLLTVPAHAQGLFPVLTNALMFYAIGTGAAGADVTIVQILNSLPPPLALIISTAQNNVAITGINAAVNGTTPLVASTINGTLNTLAISVDLTAGATAGGVQLSILDGLGAAVWANFFSVPASSTINIPINLTGLNLRFRNGLNLVVTASTNITVGAVDVNAFYSTP
jgi:hypothetical protein